nr:hypothetical protein Itr_chr14CG09370 [Ipomoea trifida]
MEQLAGKLLSLYFNHHAGRMLWPWRNSGSGAAWCADACNAWRRWRCRREREGTKVAAAAKQLPFRRTDYPRSSGLSSTCAASSVAVAEHLQISASPATHSRRNLPSPVKCAGVELRI